MVDGEIEKLRNKDKYWLSCFSQILNLFIYSIFEQNVFAADIRHIQCLITNNKYSNQVYVIKTKRPLKNATLSEV